MDGVAKLAIEEKSFKTLKENLVLHHVQAYKINSLIAFFYCSMMKVLKTDTH